MLVLSNSRTAEVKAMLFYDKRIRRVLKELEKLICPKAIDITGIRMGQTAKRPGGLFELEHLELTEYDPAVGWGGHQRFFWFDAEVEIPSEFAGQAVAFDLMTGREGSWDATNPQFTLYIDGQLVQGLDVNHRTVPLTDCAEAGRRYRITLAAFSGDHNDGLKLNARLLLIDRQTEQFYYDAMVPFQVALMLDQDDQAYINIMRSLNDAFNLLDLRRGEGDSYRESLQAAQTFLQNEFYARYCNENSPIVRCVGHTHIDVAWLWTLAVTEDKAVRSFATVLALMDEFPEYKFMSSQPQLYKYVEKNAPQVFAAIREKVAAGRWEADGAMFVEADCNIASGEALVRQILIGKRYFQEKFGVDNQILWLPDVFGYSAALPQIMKKSGLSYFMTTKISWNEFNKMPYDTFTWEGIDGTGILTHFIPTRDYQASEDKFGFATAHFTTYNGYLNPSQVKGGWQRYQQKHLNNEVLMSFGHGDGGGGPTRDMLENQRRLARGIPGCPRTVMSTAGDFFRQLAADVKDSKYLPKWSGELYLEYHRGTYTSMARNKKYNRRSEFAWQNVEWLYSLAGILNVSSYPGEEIASGWEVVLRNQFHDILPGSSIREVYDDSRTEYEQTLTLAGRLLAGGIKDITAGLGLADGKDGLAVFNPNGFSTGGPVFFHLDGDYASPVLIDGEQEYVCQKYGEDWLCQVPAIPARGYRVLALADRGSSADSELVVSKELLSNRYFAIRLDAKGQFTSIYDKRAGREIIPAGMKANVLMSYEDKPHNYDAWDINHYYREKSWEIDDVAAMEVVAAGPVCGSLKIRRDYLDSTIIQTITIWQDMARIDIHHDIDWKQKQILLKLLLPVDVHSKTATFDIQYGNVERATHSNTSWDFARFEVCMHKWLDISEDDYGISVLNDCKYGCSVQDNVIGVSLLKSAIHPNPEADKERHEFTISLYPHQGGWRNAGTVGQAYLLNNPLLAARVTGKDEQGDTLPREFSFVASDQENVLIEVVKKAEDSSDWIIRLYECYNRRTKVRLKFGSELLAAKECDLMENDLADLQVVSVEESASAIDLWVMPYEIKTLKVKMRAI